MSAFVREVADGQGMGEREGSDWGGEGECWRLGIVNK